MQGNRLWALGALAVIAVVAVLGWFLGISPKLAEANTALLDKAAVEQLNATQESSLATLRDQDADVDALRSELDVLRDGIPTSVVGEDFVDFVFQSGLATGVLPVRVTLAEAGPWGVAPLIEGAPAPAVDDGAAPPPNAGAAEGVHTVAVTVEAQGAPEALIAFSRLLQEGERLFYAETFTFDRSDDLRGILNGFLFVYVDPNAPPPADEDAEPADGTTEPTPTETPAP